MYLKSVSWSEISDIEFNLHSGCHRWFSQAHDVRKDRVVKYVVVYRQIKVADQKYCQNEQFERDLDDFWPRY